HTAGLRAPVVGRERPHAEGRGRPLGTWVALPADPVRTAASLPRIRGNGDLIQIMPLSTRSATRHARSMASLHTDPLRPNPVVLASVIGSSSFPTRIRAASPPRSRCSNARLRGMELRPLALAHEGGQSLASLFEGHPST